MKVGFIAPSFAIAGGWSIYARGVSKAVADVSGNSVVVITSTESPDALPNYIAVRKVLPVELTFSPIDQIRVFWACLQYFRGCDIIHSTYEKPMVGASLAALVLRIPFVVTVHGTYAVPPEESTVKAIIKRSLMRMAYGIAAITTTGSFNTEQRVRALAPRLPECRFIPNGYDEATFYTGKDDSKDSVILSVGWLKSRKGFDIVIDALAILHKAHPTLRYKIIGGGGDTPDLPYYKFLTEKARGLHIADHVEIRTGPITREELAKEYNRCKVFVLVSRDSGGHFEGFPMVYMEALSCGAPVVTTHGYGSEYAIKDGVQGYLVEQEDPKATAEAIDKVIRDPKEYERMKNAAIARAKEHSWTRIAPQLMQLYEDARTGRKTI